MISVMRQANGAYDMWRDSVSYGTRWTVESVFSSENPINFGTYKSEWNEVDRRVCLLFSQANVR